MSANIKEKGVFRCICVPEHPKPAHLLVGGGPSNVISNSLGAGQRPGRDFDALRYTLQLVFDSCSLLRYQVLGQDFDALLLQITPNAFEGATDVYLRCPHIG